MKARTFAAIATLMMLLISVVGTTTRSHAAVNAQGEQSQTVQASYRRFLPLVMVAGNNGGGSGGGSAAGAFWLPFNTLDNGYVDTSGTNVAVDSRGGIHVTYTISLGDDAGHRPAYYLYCPAACADPGHWTRTRLSDNVFDVRLLLDAAGHPRLMIYAYVYPDSRDMGALKQYEYATCDNSCTNAANWTITPLTQTIMYDEHRPDRTNHYFALDPLGNPAFVYDDTGDHNDHGGTFYAFCATACTDVANWNEVAFRTDGWFGKPELQFSPDGRPHIMFDIGNYGSPTMKLWYGECATNCTDINTMKWSFTALYDDHGTSNFSMRVDNLGRPRAVFYTGQVQNGNVDPYQLYYLWCNADCANPANWTPYNLHTSFGNGWSVDLALDQQNRPHFVYRLGDTGPGYAWCSANCESNNPTWQSKLIESRDTLNAQDPVNPLVHCSISTWVSGYKPALALDPQGNPRIGFDAQHHYGGSDLDHPGQPCPVSGSDIRLARFALQPQP